MNLWITLETGLREILAHKFRSILSMLGIVLGVSSLIATMGLTNGIEHGTRVFMEQIGGLELVSIIQKEVSADRMDFSALSPGRTIRDAEALRVSAPLVGYISPEMGFGAFIAAGPISDRKAILGVWPDHFVVARHDLNVGRFLTQLDVDNATHAMVIGDDIVQKFWPALTPAQVLGRTITINQVPFRVVGVCKRYEREQEKRMQEILKSRNKAQPPKSATLRWDPFRRKNESIIIPLTTLFYEFKSGQLPDDSMASTHIDTLNLRIENLAYYRQALDQIRSTLNGTHRGVDDFDLQTRDEWFERMETSISATRLSGGLIAIISLVVGGIGITNIMLASISERVREIGIRLAVGARGRDIFLQILVESVSVAFIGGLIGIVAGYGLIQLLIVIAPSENIPFMSVESVIISVAFAVLAGIISGIYPALRASKLDPISALRYE